MTTGIPARRPVKVLAAIALSFQIASCGRGEITAARWQAMSRVDKITVVESFRGGEKAKESKGGAGRRYPDSSETYVDRIDDHYRRDDRRAVAEIWDALGESEAADRAASPK